MKNLKGFFAGLLGLFLLTSLLAACGDNTPAISQLDSSAPSVSPLTQPAIDTPSLFPGIYSTVVKAKDYHPEFIADTPALKQYFGNWQLELTAESRFALLLNRQVVVEGDYQLSSHQLSFNSGSNWPSLCTPDEAEVEGAGTYHWSFDGKSLQLYGTDTACSVRGLVFSHPLQFSSPLATN